MKKILVIGSINIDFVYSVDELPKVGQTIIANNFETFYGGKSANQAVSISKMNGDVELVGVIGNDSYGQMYLEYLESETSVDSSRIYIAPNKNTGLATILVDKNGDNQIIVSQNANSDYGQLVINGIKKIIDECDFVVLQLEIPYSAVKEFIEYAKEKNKTVILNPSPARKIETEMLNNVDYLIVNETEFEIIFEQNDCSIEFIKQNAKEIAREHNIKNMLVTLGEHGSLFVNDNQEIFVPSKKVEAIDTTCAGDSFLGTFVTYISEGKSEKQAMEAATKVAAIVVTKQGAQASIPLRDEIDI